MWSAEEQLRDLQSVMAHQSYSGRERTFVDEVTLEDGVTRPHLVQLMGGQLHRDTILRMFVKRDPNIPLNPFTNLPLTENELKRIFGPRTRSSQGRREITLVNDVETVEAYDEWKQSESGRAFIDRVQKEDAEAIMEGGYVSLEEDDYESESESDFEQEDEGETESASEVEVEVTFDEDDSVDITRNE